MVDAQDIGVQFLEPGAKFVCLWGLEIWGQRVAVCDGGGEEGEDGGYFLGGWGYGGHEAGEVFNPRGLCVGGFVDEAIGGVGDEHHVV